MPATQSMSSNAPRMCFDSEPSEEGLAGKGVSQNQAHGFPSYLLYGVTCVGLMVCAAVFITMCEQTIPSLEQWQKHDHSEPSAHGVALATNRTVIEWLTSAS